MKRDGEIISYNDWLKVIHGLIAQIDCDPIDYGTHSLRAGGTSERDIMSESPLELQHFGHWKTLDYVFTYIRLNNPDMTKFVSTFDSYVKRRRAECCLSEKQIDEQNKSYLKLMAKNHASYL